MKIIIDIKENDMAGFEFVLKTVKHSCTGSFCKICNERLQDVKEAILHLAKEIKKGE